MSPEETFVRNADKKGILHLSEHCRDRVVERNILAPDILECIEKGTFVETQPGYPEKNEAPRILFYLGGQKNFYVVVAVEFPHYCVVVTACTPDIAVWDICGDCIKRK